MTGQTPGYSAVERIYTLPFSASFTVTCSWGPYSNCGLTGWHYGTDYSLGGNTAPGESVVAALGGTAWQFNDFTSGGPGKGCGYYIIIDHGNGHKSRYCHLNDRTVVDGQVVARGQVIGHEGSSGTTAVHLHFDTRVNANVGDCCSGTSVDPYAGPYSPDTYLWIANPPQYSPTYYNFQTWLLRTGTPLEKTISSQWTYAVADWNRDGSPDLVGIRMSGTASGMTEVHILSGAANFQIWLLHTATPLELTNATYWAFAMADWNRDGTPDLMVIKKQGATSTEVHILSGASNFQTWLLHTSTPLEKTSYNWRFETGDYNRDGVPDLYGIKIYATGSHSTELHILSGAANFGSRLLHTATPLEETVVGSWAFAVADWSLDVGRAPDFWIIKEDNTGTGSTEMHMLSGESNFQTWLLNTGTPLGITNNTYWQFDGGDYDRNQVPDLNVIKLNGASSTEMHVLGG